MKLNNITKNIRISRSIFKMIKETDTCEEIDLSKWRQLRDEIFEKYKDEEGYYFSSTGSYRSLEKKYFIVDYIVPILKGGQVQLDNLQLFAKWETSKSNGKLSLDVLEEQLKYDKNCKEDINKKQTIIDEIINQDANNIVALCEMAEIEIDNENYLEALEYSNKVLEIDSFNEHALMIKSFSSFEVRNYQENMDAIKKLIEIKQTPFRVMQLGNCHFMIKDNDKAIFYYNKALKMDIQNEEKINLNYYIANAYYAKKEYKEAHKYFQEVLKIDPENLYALNDMGACLCKLERFKEALQVLEKANSLEPNQLSRIKSIKLIKKKI